MLDLRPNCECCDKDLPNGAPDALICTFECTFCAVCARTRLGGLCPNCGGDLVRRPTRPDADAGKVSRFDQTRAQGSRSLPPSGMTRSPSRSLSLRYISTRHGSQGSPAPLGFEDVMLAGLARDGGLYVPAEWPQFDARPRSPASPGLTYAELAFRVMRPFVGDAFDEATLPPADRTRPMPPSSRRTWRR